MTQTIDTASQAIASLNASAADVESVFGSLSPTQLNWKPAADQWSIAQCLDHLLSTSQPYLRVIEEVRNGTRKQTLWQSMPILPGLFGKLLINAVSPTTARKLKAPAKFQPAASNLDPDIVRTFVDAQKRLAQQMTTVEKFELNRIVISSPVASFVTYSLLDAYKVLANHAERHIQQAKRVLNSSEFPKS
jgi:hypothetical protein